MASGASQVAQGSKTAWQAGASGSVPGLGRSPEERNGILDCKIPWTEESAGLQSVESHRVGHNNKTWLVTALVDGTDKRSFASSQEIQFYRLF